MDYLIQFNQTTGLVQLCQKEENDIVYPILEFTKKEFSQVQNIIRITSNEGYKMPQVQNNPCIGNDKPNGKIIQAVG